MGNLNQKPFYQQNIDINTVRLWIVHPRSASVETKEKKPILETRYHCDEASVCDFTNVLQDIKNCAEIQKLDKDNMSVQIFNIIDKDQEYHLAHIMDAFSIQIGENEIVRAYRTSHVKKSGRIAFVNAKHF